MIEFALKPKCGSLIEKPSEHLNQTTKLTTKTKPTMFNIIFTDAFGRR